MAANPMEMIRRRIVAAAGGRRAFTRGLAQVVGTGRDPFRLFLALVIMTVLSAIAIYTVIIERDYRRTLAESETLTRGIAATLADHLARSSQTVNLVLSVVASSPAERWGVGDSAELADMVRNVPLVRALLLADPGGTVLTASTPAVIGQSIGDRTWFGALRQAGRNLSVGDPEAGRYLRSEGPPIAQTGLWSIPVAKRHATSVQPFGGAVVALLNPDFLVARARHFQQLFGVQVAIRSYGGVLLAQSDGAYEAIGEINADPAVIASLQEGHDSGSWRGIGSGGLLRFGSFAVSRDGLFVVEVSRSRSDALARIQRDAVIIGVGAAAATILAVMGLWLLYRQAGRLRRQGLRLVESERRAQFAARSKEEFLASISHEIRTPMNGVIGMAGLLQETRLSAEQKRYADTIQASAQHLLTLLNDILDFSKLEAGAVAIEAIPFEVERELATILDLFAPAAEAKGIELVCRVGPDVPARILGDPGRFRQVLFNLLGNAVKFTPAGWVELAITAAASDAGMLRLAGTVSDTGVGFDPARVDVLFDRFTQGDNSTTREYGGTGLGLAICRRLVEAMGGTIAARPRPGGGSVFEFVITVGVQAGAAAPAGAPEFAGRSVLVVSDMAASGWALTVQAEGLGCIVSGATSGEAAWDRVAESVEAGRPFQAVLIDMRRPSDGMRLVRLLGGMAGAGGPALVFCLSQRSQTTVPARVTAMLTSTLHKPALPGRVRAALLQAWSPPAVLRPEARATAWREPERAGPPGRSGGPGTWLPRVLVAEDNPTNQLVTRTILEKAGMAVDVVSDGDEAIAAAAASAYDIVLMDVQMPRVDGLAAARHIRAGGGPSHAARIIGLTAAGGIAQERACREAGIDGFLTKPVSRRILLDAVLR